MTILHLHQTQSSQLFSRAPHPHISRAPSPHPRPPLPPSHAAAGQAAGPAPPLPSLPDSPRHGVARALGGACAGACAASGFASSRGLRGLRGGVPSPLAPAAGEGRGGLRGGLRGRGCPARGGPHARGAAPLAPCGSVRGGPRAGGAALRSLTRPDEETGHAGPAPLRGGPGRACAGDQLRGGCGVGLEDASGHSQARGRGVRSEQKVHY